MAMITISDKAQDMIHAQCHGEDFVRITVRPGGCAGMAYEAEIVSGKKARDKIIYQKNDITIITDYASLPYMYGLDIDYSDDLISAGFRFNNPSNESSCGCGGSFSAECH